ncbi:MAG TPA: bifunctional nuclease family protein [Chloroflexi bacterium]|nr:MAG: hypothetical protein B6243_06005 [Anaerolineaceae bacterium 4572_5.2]HEY84580.1 bifunctional nuclease family protein [Chloroflexota bacterium]
MIEVTIDSIRVSLMSQHRVVVLKEVDAARYLAIWIGPDTAEAITMELQNVAVARPMTHDLVKNIVLQMGAKISHIVINELRNDVFFAQIVLDMQGRSIEVDARPSDALALAVRAGSKVFINQRVMDLAGISPETGLDIGDEFDDQGDVKEEDLDIFRDFVDSLDLDDLLPPKDPV